MSGEKNNEKSLTNTRRVEVFRPGTFRAMNGQEYTFSEQDVAAMVASYDAENAPAPVVVGHPQHDDPAFGWARGFEINDDGTLVADLGDLAPEFVQAVEEGRYRKISMKFFSPDASNNPVPGSYYPRHVGFLGGAAPAVSGLAPVQFSDADATDLIEISFSLSEATESTAGIMRRVREFFIAQFGLEAADQAVPEYHIRWIEQAGETSEDVTPEFTNTEEIEMTGNADDLKRRAAELDKRERKLRDAENAAFADGLVDQGKLLPVQRDGVVALLGELSGQLENEISFSDAGEGKTRDPASLLRDILSAQPEIVPQGEIDLGEDPAGGSQIAFANPDGLNVDRDDLALHQRAVTYQNQNPGTAYIDAVAAVQEA